MRYHATRDPRLREAAIRDYMPLARRLALRYRHRDEPLEDLMQVAYVGLVAAIDRYDPARGTSFSAYAIPTITGGLRRHFRDTTWTLHVPRGVQEAALAVAQATTDLTERHGRAPTISQLAEATGLDPEAINDAIHARQVQRTRSFDQPRAGDDPSDATIADTVGQDDDRIDFTDHLVTIAPLIRGLPERERQVLHLRFAHDLTQTQIAERIGCSQMQVSRILRRTINHLSHAVEQPLSTGSL